MTTGSLFAVVVFCAFFCASAGNEVIGEPYVSCAADALYVKFRSTETFTGHVHVRFAPNRYCYQVLVTNNQIEVLIPHQDCGLSRRRTQHPDGVVIEAAMVVSFHPDFTTSDDRVFNFQCHHTHKQGQLQVGSPTPPPQPAVAPPVCSYRILDRRGGSPVGAVVLGQAVYHEWRCEGRPACIVVRNCHIVTAESKFELIDQSGCSKDTAVLGNIVYENETVAGLDVSVFGVAGQPLVFFQCEIEIKQRGRALHTISSNSTEQDSSDLLMGGDEPSSSSPVVLTRRVGRSAQQPDRCERAVCGKGERRKRNHGAPSSASEVWEVQSQRIEVSILSEAPMVETECSSSVTMETSQHQECISTSAIALVVAAALISICTIIVVLITVRQKKAYFNVSS